MNIDFNDNIQVNIQKPCLGIINEEWGNDDNIYGDTTFLESTNDITVQYNID